MIFTTSCLLLLLICYFDYNTEGNFTVVSYNNDLRNSLPMFLLLQCYCCCLLLFIETRFHTQRYVCTLKQLLFYVLINLSVLCIKAYNHLQISSECPLQSMVR